MVGGNLSEDPHAWKTQAERHAELLRSGKSTDGVAGLIVDWLLGLCRFIFSGLARLWQKRSGEGIDTFQPFDTLNPISK